MGLSGREKDEKNDKNRQPPQRESHQHSVFVPNGVVGLSPFCCSRQLPKRSPKRKILLSFFSQYSKTPCDL